MFIQWISKQIFPEAKPEIEHFYTPWYYTRSKNFPEIKNCLSTNREREKEAIKPVSRHKIKSRIRVFHRNQSFSRITRTATSTLKFHKTSQLNDEAYRGFGFASSSQSRIKPYSRRSAPFEFTSPHIFLASAQQYHTNTTLVDFLTSDRAFRSTSLVANSRRNVKRNFELDVSRWRIVQPGIYDVHGDRSRCKSIRRVGNRKRAFLCPRCLVSNVNLLSARRCYLLFSTLNSTLQFQCSFCGRHKQQVRILLGKNGQVSDGRWRKILLCV